MAKGKKVKTNKKNTKMRRTVLGALSAVFMISALIVAAIPSSQSKAVDPLGAQQEDPYVTEMMRRLKKDIEYHDPSTFADSVTEFRRTYLKPAAPLLDNADYVDATGLLKIKKDTTGNGVVVGCSATATSLEVPTRTVAFDANGGQAMSGSDKLYRYVTTTTPDPNSTPENHLPDIVTTTVTPWYNTDSFYSLDNNTGAVTFDDGVTICKEDPYGIIVDSTNNSKYTHVNAQDIQTYEITAIGEPTGGKGVFEGCSAGSITLGNALTYIGDRAFANTRALQSIEVPASVEHVGDYAFFRSGIASYSGGGTVTEYGTGCFANSNLGTFSCNNMNLAIGPYCFADCNQLKSVNLDCLNFIGDGAFYKCVALERLKMGDNVNNIDTMQNVAYGCTSLLEITLPKNGRGAFDYSNVTGCEKLQKAIIESEMIKPDCGQGFYDDLETSYDNAFSDHDGISPAPRGTKDVDCFGPINLGIFTDTPRLYNQEKFSDFYIYGQKDDTEPGNAYNYAKAHSIAFAYEGDNLNTKFEKFYRDYTYIVEPETSTDISEVMPGDTFSKNMIIPGKIGPYVINGITDHSVRTISEADKNKIEYVEIPKQLTKIGTGTFNDFIKLGTVKFDDAMRMEQIETGAFYTGTKQTDNTQLRFIGEVSKDGVLSVPYEYAMDPYNSYNDPAGWDKQYITYCTAFPTNQQIRLNYNIDPITHNPMDIQPTLVGIPTLAQANNGTQYSLDPLNATEENEIAQNAYTKYQSVVTVEDFMNNLSDMEQAVINACTRPEIPYGVMSYYYDDSDPLNIKSVFNADGAGNGNLVAVTMNSIKSIGERTFEGCDKLVRIEMRSSGEADGEKIGNNAFGGLANLETVILPSTLSEMGIAPFRDCEKLNGNGVDLGSGGKFSIANDIIYEAIDGGKKIVECLPIRGDGTDGTSNMIGTQDVTDVTKIAALAFYNCKNIKEADLSASPVKNILESTFENAAELQKCTLSDKTKNIGEKAFIGTKLYEITIPAMGVALHSDAFESEKPLKLRGYRDSGVDSYADEFANYTFEEIRNVCIISFIDTLAESEDKKELGTKMVETGSTLGEPVNYNPPVHDGYTFIGWDPEDYYTQVVTGNMTVKTVYSDNAEANYIIGYYINEVDEAPFYKETVARDGFAAGPPAPVMRAVESAKPGYEFVGWSPSNFADIPITKDLKVVAQYVYTGVFPSAQPSVSGNAPGPSAYPSSNPGGGSGSGGTTVPTVPTDAPDTDSNDSAGSSSDNDGNSGNNEGSNGSNSGNNNSGTSGGNNNSTGNNNNNNNSGNNNSGTNNSQQSGSNVSGNRPGSSSSQTSSTTNGSSIHVTKSGISNTGVAGVNVNGSQDNYVVKVSDSEEARTLAQQALLSEYGNLDSIKYFAMDISLYDSTGTTKLDHETGVSVDVTIPIPDALREYGGNNMIGSVKGGQLEKLNNRFTTIDGVPCMTFTATHFSPYAIYVDTNNLTASGIIDTTPKTADPLEPKWFLAIGLALLSILMFLLRGPKNQIILSE